MQQGYQVVVQSYENDADSPQTNTITGVKSVEDVRFLVYMADAFAPTWKKPNPYVKGNRENDAVGFLELYKSALNLFPDVSDEFRFEGTLPSEDEVAEYDEDSDGDNVGSAPEFLDWFHELMTDLLGQASEAYWDFKNFMRCSNGITVYHVPCDVEDVTNRFINQ